jgi:hypothetical protein
LNVTTETGIYPATALARTAVSEGVITADDDLLQPRFYLAHGLDGWVQEEVARWLTSHPHWQG